MATTLHIVTQCTDRKRASVPAAQRLGSFAQRTSEGRLDAWSRTLAGASGRVRTRDLYAGEHWVTSLIAYETALARGFKAHLWVASAGHGLVGYDEEIAPYSATFAAGSADSILTGKESASSQRSRWWSGIQRRRASAHSLRSLVRPRNSKVLVIASRAYLQAMSEELSDAGLLESDSLIIITGESTEATSTQFARHCVVSTSRLLGTIGGSRIGLHARLASALLDELPPTKFAPHQWQNLVQKWELSSPPLERFDRLQMTDAEVRQFARSTESASWSRALRELRASGRACEQKRFKRLFGEERAR